MSQVTWVGRARAGEEVALVYVVGCAVVVVAAARSVFVVAKGFMLFMQW